MANSVLHVIALNFKKKSCLKEPQTFSVVVLVFEAVGNFSYVFPRSVSIRKECTKPSCILLHGVFLLLHKSHKTASKNYVDIGSK